MSSRGSILFISCGIFQEELEYLIREKGLNWQVVYLEAALHVNFDSLKKAFVTALEENRLAGREIRVVYGHCHPEMNEILERYGARRIEAGNCLEAMVGVDEIARLNEEGTAFFLSAGWVNHWEKMFEAGRKDFDFDFRSMFTAYQRIIVFETGIIPIDEKKVEAFSQFTNLPVERKNIRLDHLFELIDRL